MQCSSKPLSAFLLLLSTVRIHISDVRPTLSASHLFLSAVRIHIFDVRPNLSAFHLFFSTVRMHIYNIRPNLIPTPLQFFLKKNEIGLSQIKKIKKIFRKKPKNRFPPRKIFFEKKLFSTSHTHMRCSSNPLRVPPVTLHGSSAHIRCSSKPLGVPHRPLRGSHTHIGCSSKPHFRSSKFKKKTKLVCLK